MLPRVRALPLLLLLGCAGRDPASDLDVRLAAKGAYALGKPALVALVATNHGSREVCFDVQGLHHSPYEVRTADGRRVDYVDPRAGGIGTMQHFVSIKPGQTIVLDEIDLAAQFAILDPGDYVARFTGLPRWGLEGWEHDGPPEAVLIPVPESAPLRFSVADGPLAPRERLLRALLPPPEGWILFKDGEGLTFLKSKVPGSGLHARASLSLSGTLSPLRLSGKGERAPGDDAVEAELNRTNPLPRFLAERLR
jgi:hypothetical protein